MTLKTMRDRLQNFNKSLQKSKLVYETLQKFILNNQYLKASRGGRAVLFVQFVHR